VRNIGGMETPRRPPVLDMTADGQFRDAAPAPASKFDRVLARVGGMAVLAALAAGGIVVAGLAILFAAIALPVLIIAGAIGAGTLWWRLRRARRNGETLSFVVIRR
jgi:hypothetical protein